MTHFLSRNPSKVLDNVDYVAIVFNDRRRDSLPGATLRGQIELTKVPQLLVDLSTSIVDLGKVGSDSGEVTPTTTYNLPSSSDVITTLNAEVVLL